MGAGGRHPCWTSLLLHAVQPHVHNLRAALVDTLTDGMPASTQLQRQASPDAALLAHPLSFTATRHLGVQQKRVHGIAVSCVAAWAGWQIATWIMRGPKSSSKSPLQYCSTLVASERVSAHVSLANSNLSYPTMKNVYDYWCITKGQFFLMFLADWPSSLDANCSCCCTVPALQVTLGPDGLDHRRELDTTNAGGSMRKLIALQAGLLCLHSTAGFRQALAISPVPSRATRAPWYRPELDVSNNSCPNPEPDFGQTRLLLTASFNAP